VGFNIFFLCSVLVIISCLYLFCFLAIDLRILITIWYLETLHKEGHMQGSWDWYDKKVVEKLCVVTTNNDFLANLCSYFLNTYMFFSLIAVHMPHEKSKYDVRFIRVITKLPNTEQSSKGKGKIHKSTNKQNQSTTGKLGQNRYNSSQRSTLCKSIVYYRLCKTF